MVAGQLPLGQLPCRTTTPIPITHRNNYPPRIITPVGKLPPRTITPMAITAIGKLLGIISTALPSLTGNRGEYFRVVGILEMVEKKREIPLVCY